MHGDHDLSAAPNLVHELEQAFDAGAPVVVDLTEVAFMDSAILNALLKARGEGWRVRKAHSAWSPLLAAFRAGCRPSSSVR